MNAHVVLLHGLWMRGFAMGALARRLRAAGCSVETFDYASVHATPARAVERLAATLARPRDVPVHVVAHSLGGLVTLETLRAAGAGNVASVVCLGSPLRGSVTARRLGHWPGGRLLIGHAFELLRDGIAPWAGAPPVGVIAGRLPYGLGVLVAGLTSPHDGTVAVAETELPGIAAHLVLPATHTGLLFSDAVAAQCVAFIARGAFDTAANA